MLGLVPTDVDLFFSVADSASNVCLLILVQITHHVLAKLDQQVPVIMGVVLQIKLKLFKFNNFVVDFVQSFVLHSFLVLDVFEPSWHKVVEDSLRFINHVLEKVFFLVYFKEVHVRHLLDSVKVQVTFFVLIVFRQKQFQNDQKADY